MAGHLDNASLSHRDLVTVNLILGQRLVLNSQYEVEQKLGFVLCWNVWEL